VCQSPAFVEICFVVARFCLAAESAALPEPALPAAAASGKRKDKVKDSGADREGTPSPALQDSDPTFAVNPSTLRPFLMRPADFGAPITRVILVFIIGSLRGFRRSILECARDTLCWLGYLLRSVTCCARKPR
jgi:hypothetical protein